jgi:hypothetical protein
MDHILHYHLIYEFVVITHKQSLWNLTNLGSLYAVKTEINQPTWQISTFTKQREHWSMYYGSLYSCHTYIGWGLLVFDLKKLLPSRLAGGLDTKIFMFMSHVYFRHSFELHLWRILGYGQTGERVSKERYNTDFHLHVAILTHRRLRRLARKCPRFVVDSSSIFRATSLDLRDPRACSCHGWLHSVRIWRDWWKLVRRC